MVAVPDTPVVLVVVLVVVVEVTAAPAAAPGPNPDPAGLLLAGGISLAEADCWTGGASEITATMTALLGWLLRTKSRTYRPAFCGAKLTLLYPDPSSY